MAMSPPPCDISEELIQKLVCTEEQNLGGMIRRNLFMPETTPIRREPANSSLGHLDALPFELLSLLLDFLDFQTLSRLSRVCLTAKRAVEALPSYLDMLTYAPDVLVALGWSRLLRHHSAMLLRQTLRSEQCASCFNFGGFFFLATCERVCFDCLLENIALRMTTFTFAKKCFQLSDSQIMESIPVMYSITGSFTISKTVSRRRVYRLVSVKQVKKLAIEVHGSAEKVATFMPTAPTGDLTLREVDIMRQLHEASLEPPGCDLSRQPEKANRVDDDFGGMASIRMPSLKGSRADRGRLCKGCHLISEHHLRGLLPNTVLEDVAPNGVCPKRPLLALKNRLHSREGFLEHIRSCHGADCLRAREIECA